MAEGLGVQDRPDILLTDVIVDTFRERRTLLVLDNCEHLVDTAARLLEALLAACRKYDLELERSSSRSYFRRWSYRGLLTKATHRGDSSTD